MVKAVTGESNGGGGWSAGCVGDGGERENSNSKTLFYKERERERWGGEERKKEIKKTKPEPD